MISIIVLGVVAITELAVIAYILRMHAEERHRLLERIPAPDAPRMAAIADAFASAEIRWDDDLQLINAEEYAV